MALFTIIIIAVITLVISLLLGSACCGDGFFIISAASIIVLAICLIALLLTGISVMGNNIVDAKIAMYEEENSRIEERIDTLVSNYLEYEQGTFAELKLEGDQDIVALMSLYPELKADVLVQEQMDIYVKNNQNIRKLREKKINLLKTNFIRWIDLALGKE